MSEKRRRARQKKIDAFFEKGFSHPVKYIGNGYEYSHKASMAGMRAGTRYHTEFAVERKVGKVLPTTSSHDHLIGRSVA